MSSGSLYIGGQQLPALPPVIDQEVSFTAVQCCCRTSLASGAVHEPLNAFCTVPQAVQQLVSQLASGNEQQRIVAAHTLSHLLETEEAKYRALVGDPHLNPNLRSHYTIGKVLSVLKVRRWLCSATGMHVHVLPMHGHECKANSS